MDSTRQPCNAMQCNAMQCSVMQCSYDPCCTGSTAHEEDRSIDRLWIVSFAFRSAPVQDAGWKEDWSDVRSTEANGRYTVQRNPLPSSQGRHTKQKRQTVCFFDWLNRIEFRTKSQRSSSSMRSNETQGKASKQEAIQIRNRPNRTERVGRRTISSFFVAFTMWYHSMHRVIG